MHLHDYQDLAARTSNGELAQDDRMIQAVFGLVGETGELTDAIKKHLFHGHDLSRLYASKELGDILWYVAELCTILELPLAEVAAGNIRKLKARYPDGFSYMRSIEREDEL
jgi:NTP pyrophosphatase (non-canonical NTP hydrolase)